MNLKCITKEDFFTNLRAVAGDRPWQKNYLVMYSSLWQAMVTDPDLMVVPIDDHLVHRGDGVFEVIRCIHGKVYQLEAHLKRLERSAKAIGLNMPAAYSQVREIIKALIVKGGERDCLIRIIISRGPGSFTTNPFDCPSSHIYVSVLHYHRSPEAWYQQGIPVMTSRIPGKQSFFANIKSCNYLPNVLMKMEAIQAGCQYSIALDENGFLAEGSTENVGILSQDGFLKFPGLENTLAGITLCRVFELAEFLVKERLIKGVQFAKLPLSEAYLSSEVMLLGTSINILPVVNYDGRQIGNGRPGPVFAGLSELLEKDMLGNTDLLTDT